MKSYLKYYDPEKDLFPEIHSFFHKNEYLTPQQFFSIIIWKSNRTKSTIKQRLLAGGKTLDNAVRDLTSKISRADTKEKKLEVSLPVNGNTNGLQLAIASAILTVLYPDVFTVYDFRVRSQLTNPKNQKKPYPDITYSSNVVFRYFNEYVSQVQEFADAHHLLLREADRELWGKSSYEDLKRFVEK